MMVHTEIQLSGSSYKMIAISKKLSETNNNEFNNKTMRAHIVKAFYLNEKTPY
jgi:hypothetical protein